MPALWAALVAPCGGHEGDQRVSDGLLHGILCGTVKSHLVDDRLNDHPSRHELPNDLRHVRVVASKAVHPSNDEHVSRPGQRRLFGYREASTSHAWVSTTFQSCRILPAGAVSDRDTPVIWRMSVTLREAAMVDETKLNQFIGKILGDLGGALSVPLVRMGDKLGLYKALNEQGPMTSGELAAKTNVAERYAREWLSHQAASGYLEYEPATGKFTLPPEQAMVFADPDSPVYLQGGFDVAAVMLENQPLVEPAFRTGKGVGWGDQSQCLFCTTGRFFRPGYQNNLVSSWLPALDGVTAKLESGAAVADVGCGHGYSTIFMAKAFPKSTFVGYDFHPASVEQARVHAEQHDATANTKFEVAMASNFPGKDLDLVTFFDCLHDMGDPIGAARHVRQTLKPDGSWMIVEPAAGDKLEDNLNPVSRMFFAASTMICVPTSLDQPVGAALGAQAGFAKLSSAIKEGGFGKVRKATETPFNMILEARA
jgi:SAM-dependent methyltransferase